MRISDLEPDLQPAARQIPEDVREILSVMEARLRCEEALALRAEADTAGEGVKADRLRAKASLVLKAISPGGWDLAMRALNEELSRARLDQDGRREWQLQEEVRAFQRRNPMPSPERVVAAINAAVYREAGKLPPIPPPMPSHQSAITRRFRGSRKGRR